MMNDALYLIPAHAKFPTETKILCAAFKAVGCDAALFVEDRFERQTIWYGLTGTPDQLAATFHAHHNLVHESTVIAFLDLRGRKNHQPVYFGESLPPALDEAVKNHDHTAFHALPMKEKMKKFAKITYEFQAGILRPLPRKHENTAPIPASAQIISHRR